MRDRFGLAGKAALVVGGGQGIGEATSLALANAGCRIVVLDLEIDRAKAVVAKISEAGGQAIALSGNVLEDQQAIDLVNQADEALGGLDVLVTVVGSTAFVPFLETTLDQWDLEQRINVRYAFVVGQAFANHKVRRGTGGTITFVASVSGVVAAPRHAPYGAAKAGLIHLVKSMATELAPHNIRVNAIAPGSIITPRLPDTESWREQISRSALPMQRRGQVDEIALPILFMASDMSSYVTGQTLNVDGGLTAANIMAIPPKLDTAR